MRISIKKSGLDPKDQIIKLDESVDIIDAKKINTTNSEFRIHVANTYDSNSYSKYIGKEFRAKYLGLSRIDSSPVFIIDTLIQDREDKISQILN
jgi:hypothetical protein